MQDFGLAVGGLIKSDASAALGIIQRQGLGKMRHIDTSYLYIQQINAEKILKFAKTPGSENPSDLCTKGLASPKILDFVQRVGFQFVEGRSEIAPNLQT